MSNPIYEVTKISPKRVSNHGNGHYRYFFFKGNDGKSYKSCITNACRNYERWKTIKVGDHLTDLKVLRDRLIDADSLPKLVQVLAPTPPAQPEQTQIPSGEPIKYDKTPYERAVDALLLAEKDCKYHPTEENRRRCGQAARTVEKELAKIRQGQAV